MTDEDFYDHLSEEFCVDFRPKDTCNNRKKWIMLAIIFCIMIIMCGAMTL